MSVVCFRCESIRLPSSEVAETRPLTCVGIMHVPSSGRCEPSRTFPALHVTPNKQNLLTTYTTGYFCRTARFYILVYINNLLTLQSTNIKTTCRAPQQTKEFESRAVSNSLLRQYAYAYCTRVPFLVQPENAFAAYPCSDHNRYTQ